MYEFVSKKEYRLMREEIEEIIKSVQKILKKKNSKLTFQFHLVGSAGRHLITRIKDGNAGYDFDYNLILNPNCDWHEYARVRKDFFKAFQEAIKGTKFNKIEDSTSVITIKQVSKKKIFVGCDFSIIFYPDNDLDYYQYAKLDKTTNKYIWETRSISKNCTKKLCWLKDKYENIWNDIKEEYLKLKNNNPQNKHSYVLFHEAVNNIYNQLKNQ